jgi:hypothetical protein
LARAAEFLDEADEVALGSRAEGGLAADRALQVDGCRFRRPRFGGDRELRGDPGLVLGREFVAEVTVLFLLGAAVADDSRRSRAAVGALVDGLGATV